MQETWSLLWDQHIFFIPASPLFCPSVLLTMCIACLCISEMLIYWNPEKLTRSISVENTCTFKFRGMLVCYGKPRRWLTRAGVNTLRPRQSGRRFADDLFKCIFLNENVWISIQMSVKFVPRGPINNIPILVQILAWCRPSEKPLSEPMIVKLPMHIRHSASMSKKSRGLWTIDISKVLCMAHYEYVAHRSPIPLDCQCVFNDAPL